MAKGKDIDVNYIHSDTKMVNFRTGKALCIAFDFGGKTMRGFAVEDPVIAGALAGYFKQMQKSLKKTAVPKKVKETVQAPTA